MKNVNVQSHIATTPAPPWWMSDSLQINSNGLTIGGLSVSDLADEYGTALYVYDLDAVTENYRRLVNAFEPTGHPFQILYAVKANRFGPIVQRLRELGAGIDAASPGEVEFARARGFSEEQISFTNVSVSQRDVDRIAHLDITFNCDSLSVLNKVAKTTPGRTIGLRINPQVGVGVADNFTYAGVRATKFGIYRDNLKATIDLARDLGLKLNGLHMHVGCGWTGTAIDQYFGAVDQLMEIAGDVIKWNGPLYYINVGGGLGIPVKATDKPIDLALYANGLVERIRTLDSNIRIVVEPGDFLVKNSGILVAEVTMVERKGDQDFIGLDTGFHVHTGSSHYNLYQEFVHVTSPTAPNAGPVTIVGNINEVVDTFAAARDMPTIEEGDRLAMLYAAGYGSSMTMPHCLREPALEIAIADGQVVR